MLSWIVAIGLIVLSCYYAFMRRIPSSLKELSHPFHHGKWNLEQVRSVLTAAPVPIVHLDVLRQNTETIFATARSSGKRLRVATKSLRVPDLIDMVTELGHHEPMLMCYSVKEAAFLIDWSTKKHGKNRFCDILIAYPTGSRNDVLLAHQLNQTGAKVVLMVDSDAHLDLISNTLPTLRDGDVKLPVCIDVDASLKFRSYLHLGAHRSPCETAEQFENLVQRISNDSNSNPMRLAGVMTYEAQIAGVGDNSRHSTKIFNWAIRSVKWMSARQLARLRKDIQRIVQAHDIHLDFFNGGGTGNLEMAASDPYLTEITAGSGFLQPELFDYYVDNMCSPALVIALEVCRVQASHTQKSRDGKQLTVISDTVCCKSGGFTSSGPPSADKAPSVFLPRGLEPFPDEGFGEVQTPLKVSKSLQKLGLDPKLSNYILIRPAKSGEIAERFPKYLLIDAESSASKPPTVIPTYRGFGKAFY